MDAFDSEEFDAISWINSNLSSNSNNNKDSSAENDHTINHQRISTLIMKLQILAQVRHFETSPRNVQRFVRITNQSFICLFNFFFSLNHMYFDPYLNHLHIIHQLISHDIFLQ